MYVITYDVGTTGLKSCLYEISKDRKLIMKDGEVEEYALYVLDNGGIEQDPMQWWDAMCRTTKRLLGKTGIEKEEIKGISFCAQMQAVVLVDENCIPVRNAMSYMDNRGSEQMKKGIQTGIKIAGMNAYKLLRSLKISGAVSGSVKDPVWKYRWVCDNEPEVFSRVYKWLDVKDFLSAKASGRFTMSGDSAFSTLLYDTRPGRKCFSSALCRMMGVDMKHLPEIVLSTDCVGGITEKSAQETGLAAGTPVFSGGGDASLIGVGAGAVRPGDTHVYMGTSGWVSTVISKQKLDVGSMIASIVGVDPDNFNCFAELETAGKCFEWAKQHMIQDDLDIYNNTSGKNSDSDGCADFYEKISESIRNVPAGSNGVIFTPWLHGNRCPFEDPDARGMFFNIGLETTAGDMYRAVIEGVCLHLRWQMEAMSKLISPSEAIRFAGGCSLQDENCQILCDVLGKRIEVVENSRNTGTTGAAALIGIGLGEISSIRDIRDMVKVERTFVPNTKNSEVYDKLSVLFRNLYKANRKNFRQTAVLRNG